VTGFHIQEGGKGSGKITKSRRLITGGGSFKQFEKTKNSKKFKEPLSNCIRHKRKPHGE